jgi:hypothetical protein
MPNPGSHTITVLRTTPRQPDFIPINSNRETKSMALQIVHLFDAASSESETEAENPARPWHTRQGAEKLLKNKVDELEEAALEGIRINHHLKMAKEAIKAKKPPKGLTPRLKCNSLPWGRRALCSSPGRNDKIRACRLLTAPDTLLETPESE